MRYLLIPICLMLSVLVTGSAWADDDSAENEDRGDRRAEMRRKIMDEFDADGDGELSDEERAKAREEMRSRRGGQARGGEEGDPRARRGEAEGRRGRRDAAPDPAALFDKFDADKSGSLSRDEFKKLVGEMRPPRPPRGPGGPDGPPEEGRRRFDRDRPLQNPGADDGERPRRRPEGRRRSNDEEGPAEQGPRGRGRRGSGDRGPGAGGPGGPPNPDAIFDRFDSNEDGELSKAEFMKLADRMSQMREGRGGRGPGGERGMRDGRRSGRGGPGGEDGPQRRRRPARPEFDDDTT